MPVRQISFDFKVTSLLALSKISKTFRCNWEEQGYTGCCRACAPPDDCAATPLRQTPWPNLTARTKWQAVLHEEPGKPKTVFTAAEEEIIHGRLRLSGAYKVPALGHCQKMPFYAAYTAMCHALFTQNPNARPFGQARKMKILKYQTF